MQRTHLQTAVRLATLAAFSAVAASPQVVAPMRTAAVEVAALGEGTALQEEGDSWTGHDRLGPPTTLSRATAGALLLATDVDGVYRSAPTIEQDVSVEVFGLIARTTVEQRFANPTHNWVEAVYVFPLPPRCAVDELRMRIGDREIVGEIQEQREARRTYEAAKAAGKKASLVSQERPNIFTNAVANIGPLEQIVVTIEYQEDLRYDDGRISLRFPMVVAPRYIPGTKRVAGFSGSGWAANTDRVPDAQRITPPLVLTSADLAGQPTSTELADLPLDRPSPKEPGPNPVTLRVLIDHNLTLEGIESPSHDIRITEDSSAYRIELSAGRVGADRDFVLEWWPERRSAPQAALYTHDFQDHTYAHLMVVPPQAPSSDLERRAPRELLFVIDTSGSMGGTSIEQAKKALQLALDRLQPDDTFGVIEFNSTPTALFWGARRASHTNLDRARRLVARLEANGGTEILSAVELALSTQFQEASEGDDGITRVRQIVFITDGAVGNEMDVLSLLEKRLGERRLFTVGIGSAPNAYFMRRAAAFGRGTFTLVSDLSEVERRMGELFAKIESPALIDIEASWLGWSNAEVVEIDATPSDIPDLYAGEPVVLNARLPVLETGTGELVLRGRRGNEIWETRLPIERGAERRGVDRLWARQKVRSLMDQKIRGADPETVRTAVVTLGLAHHLVTQYTSLVAVDTTPTRPDGLQPTTRAIPARLPAGWDAERLLGPLPKGGTHYPLLIVVGLAGLALAGVVRRLS